ncbi:PAS domain S-box-containing protein [Methanolinea mesophila]|uniref:PAS domain-containing sensor histidine kinase n=1 Tax=Methanolinea mesophila TaxID=547055 RepID=UPI001AE15FC3|nr:PAS domain S-box protein [Methanolinea mesophila]MBP1927733.1 PAS domain S-box-containing protein [Methanolinea mesophila]
MQGTTSVPDSSEHSERHDLEERTRTEELYIAYEELRATEEELRKQNDALRTFEEELRTQNEILRATQKKLAEEREKYFDLFENAPVGYVVTDGTGIITTANRLIGEMLHIHPESLKGRSIGIFIEKTDGSDTGQKVQELLTGVGITREAWMKSFEGQCIPVLISITSTSSTTGPGTGLRWVIRDITEGKRAEEELKASRAKYQALTETTSDFIWETDAQGRYTYCSPQMERLWGLRPDEMIGKSFLDMIPPPERERVRETFRNVIRSSIRFEGLEINSCDRRGNLIHIEVSGVPFFDRNGELKGYRGITRDITRRKRVEEALRESEYLRRLAQEITCVGSFEWNIVTGVNTWTPELEALYGLPEGGFAGTQPAWEELVHPGDRARAVATVQRAFKTNETVEDEWRVIWPDGSIHWLAGRYRIIRNDAGAPQAIVGVNFDITERKIAEDALNEYAANLKRSNEDLERFAYVASHDLREPLRMVTSFSQLLEKNYKGRLDEDADEFIGYIVEGGRKMDALVNDLLEYSRITSQGKPFEPTDLNIVLEEAQNSLSMAIEENKARIEVGVLPTVNVDHLQILLVFQNLLSNAIKFHDDTDPVVSVKAVRREKEWEFLVRDNGIGIDPAYHEKIFEIFQRLHSRNDYHGTGIGLAICKRIVERHGGRIWVESEPGKGSTFFFTIPERT